MTRREVPEAAVGWRVLWGAVGQEPGGTGSRSLAGTLLCPCAGRCPRREGSWIPSTPRGPVSSLNGGTGRHSPSGLCLCWGINLPAEGVCHVCAWPCDEVCLPCPGAQDRPEVPLRNPGQQSQQPRWLPPRAAFPSSAVRSRDGALPAICPCPVSGRTQRYYVGNP